MKTIYRLDEAHFQVNVTFPVGCEFTTLEGMSLTAVAEMPRVTNSTSVVGVATKISGQESVLVAFSGGAFAPGRWTVQVRAIPPGRDGDTLCEIPLTVLESWE